MDLDPVSPEQEAELFDSYVDEVEEAEAKALSGGRSEKGYAPVGFIRKKSGSYCGATLIKKDVAVTAAHCMVDVKDNPSQVKFHLGRKIGKSTLQRTIKQIRLHPLFRTDIDYTKAVGQYDIALIFLKKPVEKVKLAKASTTALLKFKNGESVSNSARCDFRFIGYGGADGKYSNDRRSTKLCMTTRTGTWQMAEPEKGFVCPGDSGGAIVREKTLELVAILSGVVNPVPGSAPLTCFQGKLSSKVTITYPLDADATFVKKPSLSGKLPGGVTEIPRLP